MKRRTPWGLARLFVILVLVVVAVSMMGMVAFAQAADNSAEKECYLIGDMNADGRFSTDDAIYTLYYTFYPDDYPLKQSGDFTGDDAVKTADAIELLYATFYGDWPEYEKFGTAAHDFYDPAWSWKETSEGIFVNVTLQCACGEGSHALEVEEPGMTLGQTVAATCTKAGSQEYIVTISDHDETFTATYTKSIPATGHEAVSTGFDEDQHYELCGCGEVLNAVSHSWEADGEASVATCQVASVQNYKCSCGATKSEQLGFAEHAWEYVEDVLLEGQTCRFAKLYDCENCEETKLADEYDSHAYAAAVTKEATCQEDGVKSYTCTRCGAVEKTEAISRTGDEHIWNNGEEANGVITYSCTVSGCGQTKTTVTTKEDGTVSKDAIQSADQLELGLEDGNATLEMDQNVKDGLDADKQILITVEAMDVAAAEEKLQNALTDQQKEQIGENKVYDFNMNYHDGQKVEFTGEITVSLPYTLEEGEDVDAITVWYIADDGTLEEKAATYNNGYVTFTTDHFSYYTVTRLTPAERCGRYGHIYADVSKAPTCSNAGYTVKICQRCAAEAERVDYPALSHNYVQTVTEPTCNKFGSVVETCDRCGHTKSKVTPALGHDMQLSNTVKATCDAAGEEIYTCQNEGCDHTTKKALPQLTHDYQQDKEKTVAATCTAGGYDVHVCTHCGDEIKKNETAPIGHKYGNEAWTWAEDDSSAILTLTCENGCGVNKELEASIAVVKATCTGDGTLKASVYYNNKSYTDEKAGASATGHIPGKEWVTTETQHYYKCVGCDEKLEAASHDFGEGVVTKEPTCTTAGVKTYTCSVCGYTKEEVVNASGKHSYDDGVVTKAPTCAAKGTKLYTCTACGFTREEAIAATGEHTYVNGTCSVCGKQETACNHYRTSKKQLDVSAFDICEGIEIYEISCECGERRILEVENISCELKAVSEEDSAFGVTYIEECVNCGLHAESGQKIVFNADPCRAELTYWGELTLDGDLVAEFSLVEDSADHYVHILTEEFEITDQGMCKLTVETHTCDCGERVSTGVSTSCQWVGGPDNREVCSVCGGSRTWEELKPVWDGCKVTYGRAYTYSNKDGEEVYSYTSEEIYYEHSEVVTDYELYGETCADGIWVEYTCTECGEVRERYYEDEYHPMVEQEVTDLTDANICAGAHIQESCPCGREKHERLEFYGDVHCQWAMVEDPNERLENPSTGSGYTERYVCSTCGAVRIVDITYTEKDENCVSSHSEICTYQDAKGNVLAVGQFLQTSVNHSIQYEYDLQGESCEDGVTITEYCADCGMSNSWDIQHHEVMETHYSLHELGFCGGDVFMYSCPCGEESRAEVRAWVCEWRTVGDPGWTRQVCRNCGGTWEESWEKTQIDDCHSQTHYIHSLCLADGTEVVHLDYVEKYTDHRWIAEFDGTCQDDYHYVYLTCLSCGESETSRDYGHDRYPVARELVTDGQLCGEVEMVTYSCACGENTHTEINWIGGECDFRHTGFGEEEDSYIYTCMTCGAIRYERNYHEQVPGGTECQGQHRWEYSYMKDDQVLFVESGIDFYGRHEWLAETELLGESCNEGVIVRETCTKCGMFNGEYINYHHEVYGKHYDLAELGFCGGRVYQESCACGEYAHTEIEPWGCDWTGMGDEGWEYHECLDCGGIWEVWYEETQIDQCNGQTHFIHSFRLADSTEVLRLDWVEKHEHHDWELQFTLMGDSCEDGVVVEEHCTICGESRYHETYDHDWFELEYYDFSEYGFCDGYLRVVGCACGEEREVDYGSNCTWYGMGGFGGDENSISLPCEKCDMLFTMSWTDKIKLDNCHYRKDYTYTFANDEINITAEEKQYHEDHREVCKLTLEEGQSCEECCWVDFFCLDCNKQIGAYISWGSHEEYIVDRIPVELDAKVCGRVDMLTCSCACGEVTYTDYEFVDCEFGEYYHEGMGEWIIACKGCGTELYQEYEYMPVEGETCKEEEIKTVMYLQNGEAILSYRISRIKESHDTLASYTLLNPDGTCDDGYTITWVCRDCGEATGHSGVNYGCDRRLVARELLAEKGVLCGDFYLDTYSCACGASRSTQAHWEDGSCSFREYWDEEQDRWITVCDTCGVERVYKNSRTPVEGESCKYLYHENYTYYRDGAELFSYTRTYESTSHNEVAQLTLQNPDGTCDDGYTVTWVCQDCGELLNEDTEIRYGCEYYTVERNQLVGSGVLCGELYQYVNRCACGKESNTHKSWWYGSCDYEQTDYNEEEQYYEYVCRKCGGSYRRYSWNEQVEGSPCQYLYTWEEVYYNAAGEYLFTDSGSWINHNNPTWIISYKLLGQTCEDGYYRTLTCFHCGEVIEEENIRYGCSNERVAITPILDSEFYCGTIYLHEYACGCGKYSSYSIDHDCSFSWFETDEETGEEFYKCSNCGLVYSRLVKSEREPFSCLTTEDVTYRYYLEDGGRLFELTSFERTFTNKQHATVYEYTLAEGATSCEDGYYVSEHCIYCGETWNDSDIHYGHSTRGIAYYNLEDYGKCGGYLQERACACGQEYYWEYNAYGGCRFQHTGNVNEYGIYERYCEDCNTYVYMDTTGEFHREECRNVTTLYAQMVRDGVILLDMVQTYDWDSHTMVMVSYEGDCSTGTGTVTEQCYYCGEQGEHGWSGGHHQMVVAFMDLKEIGGCGGYIRKDACACGSESNLWWDEIQCSWNYSDWDSYQLDGVWYYCRDRVCENCGLTVKETYHEEEAEETCRFNRVYVYEFWQNDTLQKVYETVETYESHDYQLTGYKLNGATCEDGVVKFYTCVCGDSYNNTTYSHEQFVNEDLSIDLAQYGSVCGEKLQYSACACGKAQRYELVGECDIGSSYTSVWLEDALNEGQDTTEGWQSYYSSAYIDACAVTDPQCGLKIRRADVWLPGENCTAVHYQIWQLGYQESYDETTGEYTSSWMQEIMIPTGEVRTYHDYTRTDVDTMENGTGVQTASFVCNTCGSSYVEEREYVNGNRVRYEQTAINTLDNGESKSWSYIEEYTWTANGYQYMSLNREERTYADGNQWWSQTERSQATDGSCKLIEKHTNSNGNGYTEEYEHYSSRSVWSWEEDPTCTQPGKKKRVEACWLCEEVLEVEYYDIDPYGHDWYWKGDDYHCYRCGLENSNGADGTIIVEDLTVSYGNDTDYVVGYWNWGDGEFTVYASVILDEVTDDNDELVLSGIDFTYLTKEDDGINAVSANQAAIQEAAKAAMAEAGYTGSYAIRIAFVPADSDGTLDYAITFDSQIA